ncbi:MAG TPA: polysaccharide deacetylase family protein [Solirubrobacteraceae bacterium]|jgi:peptidoglycan/xylan/chitin deacetylase (PgdA/CDA1 family)|nr:polysaccharide deacetylase family protein [Solirubrobacteraceae bacterium]
MDPEQRRARRETRKRQLARRRARGLAALIAVIAAAIVTVVVANAGTDGSSSAPSGGSAKNSAQHASTGGSGAARAAARGAGARRSASGRGADALVTPAQAARRSGGAQAVPILMYHVINPPPAGAKFPGLYVPPEELAEQMQALAAAGYRAVTMDQMLANWTHGVALPGKPVVLSFDNGYQSQLTNAEPILRDHGWVGVENIQLTGLPPSQGGLSRAQVQQLIADGWELDTQGISHADLIAISPTALHEQVFVARSELQRRYHVPVNWFCYPSGHYDASVVEAIKAAGFVGSTTVVPGWASPAGDPYRLPRLRVLGGTTGPQLVSELAAIRSNPLPPASYSGA